MSNENERKHDPAENRQNQMGHPFDDAKTGGAERNVGQTGTTSGSAGGQSAGSGGVIGGSQSFMSGNDQQSSGSGAEGAQSSSSGQQVGSETSQVLTGDQPGADTFSGQPQSGTSAMAANNSRADLGASGAGSPGQGQQSTGQSSSQGGSDNSSGGFIGSEADEDSSEYLQRDGNPEEGFAEQGQGASESTGPGGVEGMGERDANLDSGSDIEGSSGGSSR